MKYVLNNGDHNLKSTTTEILCDADGLVNKTTQQVPHSFLTQLREQRDNSTTATENTKVASIPIAVVEKWQREGFDITDQNVTAQEILMRLKAEDLGAFITTNLNSV